MVNSRGYTQETALSQRVKTWEDAIRPELARQVKLQPHRLMIRCRSDSHVTSCFLWCPAGGTSSI